MFVQIFYGMGIIFAAIIGIVFTILLNEQVWWSFAAGVAIFFFLTLFFKVKFLKIISLSCTVIMLGLSLMKYAAGTNNVMMAIQSFYVSLGIVGLILYLSILPLFIKDKVRRNDLLKRQFSFCATVLILYSLIGFIIKGLMWLGSDDTWLNVSLYYMSIPYKWVGLLLIAHFVYKINKQR